MENYQHTTTYFSKDRAMASSEFTNFGLVTLNNHLTEVAQKISEKHERNGIKT